MRLRGVFFLHIYGVFLTYLRCLSYFFTVFILLFYGVHLHKAPMLHFHSGAIFLLFYGILLTIILPYFIMLCKIIRRE